MKKGTLVCYRSVSGQVYDAVLIADVITATNRVAIDITIPGQKEPMRFSRALWYDSDPGEVSTCWPRIPQRAKV